MTIRTHEARKEDKVERMESERTQYSENRTPSEVGEED
jgi:hypothetical protein